MLQDDALEEMWRGGFVSAGNLPLAEAQSVWAAYFRQRTMVAFDEVDTLRSRLKSPIEERFAAAICASPKFRNIILVDGDSCSAVLASAPAEEESLQIEPQARVLCYEVDLVLNLRWREFSVRLGVELDGHDFHEKTKRQAAADKSRQRKILAAGLEIVRFTGSEVFADAEACAEEVLDLLSARMGAASSSAA